ncbi:superoxide dismutase family protein [Gammaproteobacteria bacterium AB-CW1]|uniref:Superoxide dismutase [Cu-Zn] n=1 Tax=Natronospira elongata TaxID=3110268 RepID=A0AAP6ML66_9GAMM|nr:superoxide dismutase family protein [Gammaproteobacteria bacterium AB-CW1]
MKKLLLTALTAGGLLFASALVAHDHDKDKDKGEKAKAERAVAEMRDNDGEVIGKAVIRQGPKGVVIRLHLNGLPEGWKAIHIHEKGTCEDHHDGFVASGGHLDPDGREHGLMNPEGPERGDLPNIWTHGDGSTKAEIYAPGVDLHGEKAGLLYGDGTALVIHEGADDHYSQPIGGAGARIACGVVNAY